MQGKRQHVLQRAPALIDRGTYAFVRPTPAVRPAAPPPSQTAPHHLVGVSPDSVLAMVERLEAEQGLRWLLWGSVHGRPIMFTVDERGGREMLAAVAGGEEAVAIVEPWQMVGQSLD
jgi:hypothetical protein